MSVSGTGAQWSTGGAYTSSPGTAQNGQAIVVRGTASASYDGTNVITLNLGPDSTTFTIVTRAPVKNPTNWNWTDPSGQELGAWSYSQTHTIAGMEAAANLTFSGNTHNTPQMSINGAAYTAVATVSVNTGTTIRLRAISSSSYSTTTTINTAVNGAAEGGAFNITTRAPVKNPTNWNWTDPSGQELGAWSYSQTHTIAGMEAAANLTFSGNTHNTPQMSINGAAYTAVATVSVNTGTTIRLRAISSSSYSTTTTINTAVNGAAEGGAFNITTRAAVAPVEPDSLVMADVTTAAELTNVTATASGGETTGSYVQVSPDNSNWYANGTSFGSRTRNVEHTWYARNVGEDGSFSTSFSNTHTPGYLGPTANALANIAGTDDNILWAATTGSTTVSAITESDHTYIVRRNNGSFRRSD